VGLVYRYVDINYNAFVHYRECTATDCSQIQSWSATSVLPTVSGASYLEFPHLAFDTGGNVHVSWTSFGSTSIWEIYHATRASSTAPWGNPDFLGTSDFALESPAPNAMVAAGTPNNLYVAWNRYLLDANGYVTGMELQYNHGDGQGWSGAATPPRQSGLLSWAGERWGALGVDKNNVLQMVWNGAGGQIWYASKRQIEIDAGRVQIPSFGILPVCRLTEYYDTASNFRIYFTRTSHNIPDNPVESDCSIKEPSLLDSNGYPLAVVNLGKSLEKSNLEYANMNYQVDRTYREPSSGRYPIYLGSDPVWICPDGTPSIEWCWNSGSVALRNGITFNRQTTGVPYSNPSWPIDRQRTTAAHEFFHAVQYTYLPPDCSFGGIPVCLNELWWQEATASWAENKVYDNAGWYAEHLDKLLSTPNSMVTVFDDRKYGSFIFATYLEQQVANSDAVIRRTWERRATGSNMLTVIDWTLQNYYSTNLADEFPKFAWYNYFLNSNTYTRTVAVYTVWNNVSGNPTSEMEWQLFRSWLQPPRNDFQNSAGVLVDQVFFDPSTMSKSGPSRIPNTIDALGAAYIEFFQQGLTIPIGGSVDLNFTIAIPGGTNIPIADRPRVSVLPIPGDFNANVHPPNAFINPIADATGQNLLYSQTIPSFHNYRHVAVIISNPSPNAGRISFLYSSNIAIR